MFLRDNERTKRQNILILLGCKSQKGGFRAAFFIPETSSEIQSNHFFLKPEQALHYCI